MNLRTPRIYLLVGVTLVMVLAAATWSFILNPRMQQAADITEQTQQVHDGNAALDAKITRLQSQQDALSTQRAVAAALAERVPATAAQADLFTDVQTALAAAGIPDTGLEALTPSAPETVIPTTATDAATDSGAGIARMEVTMTVAADHAALIRFLQEMENMPRAYLVNAIGMASAENGNFRLTIDGSMFVMPSPAEPPATN